MFKVTKSYFNYEVTIKKDIENDHVPHISVHFPDLRDDVSLHRNKVGLNVDFSIALHLFVNQSIS